MLLELLDSRVESADTSEHLVMLLLEPLYLFLVLDDLLIELSDLLHGILIR